MSMQSMQRNLPFNNLLRLPIYLFLFFVLFVAASEVFCRFFFNSRFPDLDTINTTGYVPAISQYQAISNFVKEQTSPDCLLFGNSLVQVGLDPVIFADAFRKQTGRQITCYNFGMDGSSLRSTVPMA